MLHQCVIPAAGFGTRMLPATKAVPKELLPILDKPTIQRVVEEAADAGMDDLVLITNKDKQAIEAHFTRNPPLEKHLSAGGREALLAPLNQLVQRLRIRFAHQLQPRGLGDAVLCARDQIGNEPFMCLLGDTIFSGEPSPARQLADAFARLGTSIIGLEEVPADRVGRYGIVGGEFIEPGLMRIDKLVEKPTPSAAPSRLAIAARYILTPGIFDCLDQTRAGTGGEVQLTDAVHLFLQREPVHGIVLTSRRHDVGNVADWLLTNIHFAKDDPSLWEKIVGLAGSGQQAADR